MMRSLKLVFALVMLGVCTVSTKAQIPSKADQVKAAVQAAPEDKRDNATVLGFDQDGKMVMLRKGTNEMTCLADNPQKEGYNSACYHKDLEPFMARGRALKAEGKNSGEVFDIREKEAKAGTLQMPKNATTLHILYGSDGKYDAESGKVFNARLRYVVYIPFATAESTGLPIRPMVPGGPWIMDPGTHRAHIMISPPEKKKD